MSQVYNYPNLNHFIDSVDFPTTSFNNLGAPAFGLGNVNPGTGFSHGVTARAGRLFSQPMQVGDVFSADFDTPAEYVDLQPSEPNSGFPFAIIGFLGESGETFNIEAGSSSPPPDGYGDFPWRLDDATGTNFDYGMAAGVGSISPTATSDGSSLSLEVISPTTGRFIFDGVPLDVQFLDGPPTGVFFTLFDNTAEAAPTSGDFDASGTVDAADLTEWMGDFGVNADSDADGDGDSDGNDFLLWQRNLGAGGGMGPPTGEHAFFFDNLKIERPTVGAVGAAAVPEPASLGLWLLSLLPGLHAGRRVTRHPHGAEVNRPG